jgi:histidine ammonia-lyase
VIPAQGSVGASGDLAPLAHMAAVMIGEGEASYRGKVMPGGVALAKAGLSRSSLAPRKGLALINGTQFSTACALAGLFEAWRAAAGGDRHLGLSTDAIMGSTAPLQPEIHALRGHAGPDRRGCRDARAHGGREIRESHREGDTRVQDPIASAASRRSRAPPST